MSEALSPSGGAAPATPAAAPSAAQPVDPSAVSRQLFGAFASMASQEGSGEGQDDVFLDDASGGTQETPEAVATEKHAFDDAALDREVDVKIAGEVKSLPLREVMRLASEAGGAQKRLAEAAEERKKIDTERAELEATNAHIGEVLGDPARFFSEMLMGDVDAIQYVDRLVKVAQNWLARPQNERDLMLREEKFREREENDRRAAEQNQNRATEQSIAKVFTQADVPPALQPYIRQQIDAALAKVRERGERVTVSQLVEFAKKHVQRIEESARGRLTDEQRKALVKPEDVQAAAKSAAAKGGPVVPPTQPRAPDGRFETATKPGPRFDPMNPMSYQAFIK